MPARTARQDLAASQARRQGPQFPMSELRAADGREEAFLVADIGGTNSRLGLSRNGSFIDGSVRRYLNSDHAGFEELLADYLDNSVTGPVSGICVAVAGPVEADQARMTNVDWTIKSDMLRRVADCRSSAIINDLAAMGHGLHLVDECRHLQVVACGTRADGPGQPEGKRLLVNVGTGFNIALVFGTTSGRIVSDSESGRVTLPVRSDADYSLKSFIEERSGYAGLEDALSGRGLANIHSWICSNSGLTESSVVPDDMPTPDSSPQWREAGRVLVRLLGVTVGDLALVNMPIGGIFLVGGVANGLASVLEEPGFADAFRDKGDYSEFMQRFSVSLITDDLLALRGCASFSMKM